MEFHCTAPVKPNRAQEILYGPTLRPYLYGEQIAQTLVSKGASQPLVVCTDQEPVLALRDHVALPVGLVLPVEAEQALGEPSTRPYRVDAAHPSTTPVAAFCLGRNRLAVPAAHQADRDLIAQRLGDLSETFDLAEPFARIREAIEEAQRAGR